MDEDTIANIGTIQGGRAINIISLIPWTTAGVFMAGTLGVATVEYARWAIMNYTGFIFAIIYGFTGFKIAPKIRDDETIPGS